MEAKSHTNQLTVLVTGAASGIGAAVAKSLAKAGHHVILADVNIIAAEDATGDLVDAGYSAQAYELDVSSQQAIDQVSGKFPNIDVLINNAGIQHVAKLEDFPPRMWRRLNDILLVGPAMLTRSVLPNMKARGFGRIINIGSIHSMVASPYKSAYVAAKHGILGFSKVIALETANQDITINTICPSYVKTPLVDNQIASQAQQHGISEREVIDTIMLEPMPKKAFIETEELAGLVDFLISPAAKNMTGQSLVVDGGWTIK
ncbi:3-hydroxybutyrate dehydrogenase [Teredinibacter sp. KSP-S5-2]|uniref:3-hydroxybutyrate dehydrogenase n=1 Tax=Teredinibacter sp. KSP-S5-2 TaxID=3034506 RepID=UPI002935007F|nr:3-hydroxybutyrate dehydrogenase [Teredinibacter sp. KSP-S5-2]WNO07511.1 3-hydroxybutyrate dehydrogenase [Teredinibacter sp. KSP-S5-2]